MVPATRNDKALVVQILMEAFRGELQIEWTVAPVDRGREKRLRVLMEFAFESGLAEGEVYLTDDRNGVAVWKTPPKNSFSRHNLLNKLKFVWTMGLPRLRRLIRMEQYVERQHSAEQRFLYLWFLGVRPSHQSRGLSSELLDPMLKQAHQKGLPVLLETSNPKNVSLYQHKGFAVRHAWHLDQQEKILLRFMRKV